MTTIRAVLIGMLFIADGAVADSCVVTNRWSLDPGYLSGASGRTQMMPVRLLSSGTSPNSVSFDVHLSPAEGVLKFAGVRAPWAEFSGDLVPTASREVTPGGETIHVQAVNAAYSGAQVTDGEVLDLYFEVVGSVGSTCTVELANVVSAVTPTPETTNGLMHAYDLVTPPATFTVTRQVPTLQLHVNGTPRAGGINSLELCAPGGVQVSAFDVTLNFPTPLVNIVDVVPAMRGLDVTVARTTFRSGTTRVVGLMSSPGPLPPERMYPVATVFYAVAKTEAAVPFTLTMDINGLCLDDPTRLGYVEQVSVTNELEAAPAPGAADVFSSASLCPGDQASLDLMAFAPLAGAMDMTLIFPTNVFRFVDATADMPGMDLFYDRAQAASGTLRIIGVTASLDERCRDRLSLATVHLDVREGAPVGGTAKVRLEVNDLHALGPLPFASYLIGPVETEVSISAPEPPELALVTSNLATLAWGETVEIPVTARVRGRKPVVALGNALRDPAQLVFNAIVTSGAGAGGSVVVNTNTPGVDTFFFASLDDAASPAEGPVELFKIRYDVMGKVRSVGDAGVVLRGAAHGVDFFPNKTESLASAFMHFSIGESLVDTDGDSVPDWWAVEHFGGRTNCVANKDSDGDGCPDAKEFFADTDPCDPSSKLTITSIRNDGATLHLGWQGGTCATQYIEACDELARSNSAWRVVFTNSPPTEVWNFTDVPVAATSRFYRVRAAR